MKATIAWWNLNKSKQTIKSLRRYLKDEGVDPWNSIRGLRLKLWISDPKNNLWGAVMLWESDDFLDQTLPPNRAAELIGYPPNTRFLFDVEATIEGEYIYQYLNKFGLSYEEV